ncbi:MAG: group II intron reverse transcriptase domain-containing protein [Candidatus Yanofskybacteria bacterium]|nr:group II intron reverse transcriptase domain-containing protein [Candidatus Yanofskybacteria bacterium]
MPNLVNHNQSLNNRQGRVGGGRRRIEFSHGFDEVISLENLLESWKEFLKGKRKRKDVQEFSLSLMDNIIQLHQELANHTYNHSPYQAFRINDPKPRQIHKSLVRDRLLHHSIYCQLYPFFDRTFVSDSFSCRINKGTHRALNRFRQFGYKVGKNNTQTCWILKCDIRKFFENINHDILVNILNKYIPDKDIIWLLEKVIFGFSSAPGRGLPLGNLTSQLVVNIYMNEFDQFIKHKLKAKYYIRYADDFVVFSEDKAWLDELLPKIADFLSENLKLNIHPDKVFIKTLNSGVDFLGWVHFPDYRVLRTTTRRRMIKKILNNPKTEMLQSYRGLLQHGNTYLLKKKIGL